MVAITKAEDAKNWLEENLPVGGMIGSVIIFLFFLNLSLLIHEGGHLIVSKLFGCPAKFVSFKMFAGATQVNNCPESALVWIALAGPLLAMAYASYLYFYHKDSILRFGGMISIFYSVLPSLNVMAKSTDAAKAVKYGFPKVWAWIIFLAVSGYWSYQFLEEILDEKSEIVIGE